MNRTNDPAKATADICGTTVQEMFMSRKIKRVSFQAMEEGMIELYGFILTYQKSTFIQ